MNLKQKDPAHCPRCGSDLVRLVEMRYEMALDEAQLFNLRRNEFVMKKRIVVLTALLMGGLGG